MSGAHLHITKKGNLKYLSISTPDVLKAFYEFFTKDRISAGSVCRKMQWLLFKLVRITKCSWSAKVVLFYKGPVNAREYLSTVHFHSTHGDSLEVNLDVHNLKQYTHTLAQIRTSFAGHSYVRRPYTKAQLLFELADCKIIYSTELHDIPADEIIAAYNAEYVPLSFLEKIVSICSSRSKTIHSCVVLEVIPPEDASGSK